MSDERDRLSIIDVIWRCLMSRPNTGSIRLPSPVNVRYILVLVIFVFFVSAGQCVIIVPAGPAAVCVGDTACFTCTVPEGWCAGNMFFQFYVPNNPSIQSYGTAAGCSLCGPVNGTSIMVVCNATCVIGGVITNIASNRTTISVQGTPPAPLDLTISYNEGNGLFLILWSPPTTITHSLFTILTVYNTSSGAVVLKPLLSATGTQYKLSLYDLGLDGCSPVNNLSATVTMACNSSIGNESSAVPFPPITPDFSLADVSIAMAAGSPYAVCTYGPRSCSIGCLLLLVERYSGEMAAILLLHRSAGELFSNGTLLTPLVRTNYSVLVYALGADGVKLTNLDLEAMLWTSSANKTATSGGGVSYNMSEVCFNSTSQQVCLMTVARSWEVQFQYLDGSADSPTCASVPNSTRWIALLTMMPNGTLSKEPIWIREWPSDLPTTESSVPPPGYDFGTVVVVVVVVVMVGVVIVGVVVMVTMVYKQYCESKGSYTVNKGDTKTEDGPDTKEQYDFSTPVQESDVHSHGATPELVALSSPPGARDPPKAAAGRKEECPPDLRGKSGTCGDLGILKSFNECVGYELKNRY